MKRILIGLTILLFLTLVILFAKVKKSDQSGNTSSLTNVPDVISKTLNEAGKVHPKKIERKISSTSKKTILPYGNVLASREVQIDFDTVFKHFKSGDVFNLELFDSEQIQITPIRVISYSDADKIFVGLPKNADSDLNEINFVFIDKNLTSGSFQYNKTAYVFEKIYGKTHMVKMQPSQID